MMYDTNSCIKNNELIIDVHEQVNKTIYRGVFTKKSDIFGATELVKNIEQLETVLRGHYGKINGCDFRTTYTGYGQFKIRINNENHKINISLLFIYEQNIYNIGLPIVVDTWRSLDKQQERAIDVLYCLPVNKLQCIYTMVQMYRPWRQLQYSTKCDIIGSIKYCNISIYNILRIVTWSLDKQYIVTENHTIDLCTKCGYKHHVSIHGKVYLTNVVPIEFVSKNCMLCDTQYYSKSLVQQNVLYDVNKHILATNMPLYNKNDVESFVNNILV